MVSSAYPLQLSVITNNIYNHPLEEESNDSDWWITISTEVTSTSMVRLERIDTDLITEFSVETQYQAQAPRKDIIIPAIFGIFGISAIIGGLFLAFRIDKKICSLI
jgi:hypothetical protein